MKRAAVLLANGFEEVEAITPIDFLRRAGVEVTTVGIAEKSVTGGHNIAVTADTTVSRYAEIPDLVVVPGGMPGATNVSNSSEAIELVRAVRRADGFVAAICAAPAVVLAPHGLLDGMRATCYPGFEDHFENAQFVEDRVVVDGKTITSRGPGTAAEFALEIIRRLVGTETAENVRSRTLQAFSLGS